MSLTPHPTTRDDAWSVSAIASRGPAGELHVRYDVRGALDAMRLPPLGIPQRADGLWEHTCAEAFVAAEGTPGYVELNFSPSRAWAAYAFTAYRARAPRTAAAREPRVDVRRERDALTLDAVVALADLSPAYPDAILRVGLSMVIEAADGRRSYWALHHPSARPDFHHAEGFVLRLAHADGRSSE